MLEEKAKTLVEVVSATRLSEQDFWSNSALGISLTRLGDDDRLITHITYENRCGLPIIYNERIAATNNHAYLVFIHDDVWIDDYFFIDRVIDGCAHFDIIGVAGNQRRIDNEFSWVFTQNMGVPDTAENLSGSVAHGSNPFGVVSRFGVTPAECELLDGVFLAARKSTLQSYQMVFDSTFDFHFYDLDFSRTARENGLRLGTWPICLTHQSGGAFGSASWTKTLDAYRAKWHD